MRKSILFLAICLLVSTEGFAESVSRESTNGVKGNQEVAKAVHKALVAGSVEGLNVALPTQAQLSEWCPTVKKPLSQYVLNLTETLGRCSQSRDWAHATLKSVSGGRKRPARDKACPGVDIGQNIEMIFTFPGGEAAKVEVDNPLLGGGRIFLLALTGSSCR